MQLGIEELVEIFRVPEDEVYRWIHDDGLPHSRVGGQYHFNRAELLEWASEHGRPVPPELMSSNSASQNLPTLSVALKAGGIRTGITGADKLSVLRQVVGVLPLPPSMDRDWFLQMLLARESLGSTGIGDGIAIPHVRHPIVLPIPKPMVTLCFLDQPVDFDAVDGEPVRALFTLISPTIKTHLHLLARLGFALGHEPFRDAVRTRKKAADILAAAVACDTHCRTPDPAPSV